jgi:hypothetical protein
VSPTNPEPKIVVPEKCSDVKGAYNFNLAEGSSSQCSMLNTSKEVSVTQTDCDISLTFTGAGVLQATLDNKNRGKTNPLSVQGATIACDLQFNQFPKGLTAACQITGGGAGIVCNYSGSSR